MKPNRIAAIVAALAPAGAAVAAFLRAVPTAWQGPVVVAALVCMTAVAVVWLIGWQKHEARQSTQSGQAKPVAQVPPEVTS